MVHKFFDNKKGSRTNINDVLAQQLEDTVIKRFKRKNVYSRFKDNIWAAYLGAIASLFF